MIAIKYVPAYTEPIPDLKTMKRILPPVAARAAARAKSDFLYAIDNMRLSRDMDFMYFLAMISTGSFQNVFLSNLRSSPKNLSYEYTMIILGGWKSISRAKFENAVAIQMYMETVQEMLEDSNYRMRRLDKIEPIIKSLLQK
ncbi:MAG: hypothetical protein LBC67_07355 [Spirochaetales bacterium]|nr:hypothetical protein [Spirochaetales bacterium]